MITKQVKTIVLCFALMLIGGSVFAGSTAINFQQVNTAEDWNNVVAKAKSNNLNIFVDVYTDWCGYCKMMDRDVFSDTEVGSYFNKNFINVKLDAETTFGEGWAAGYEVTGYPTYIFLDNEESYLGEIGGYNEKASFMKQTSSIVEQASLLPELEKAYNNGSLTKSQKIQYATLMAESDPDLAEKLANEVKGTFGESDYLQSENLDFLINFVSGVEDPIFKYVKNNKSAFVNAHGSEGKDELVGRVYNITLGKAVEEKDPATLKVVTDQVLPVYVDTPDDIPNGVFVTNKLYYANIDDWDGYIKVVESTQGKAGIPQDDFWYVQAYEIIDDYNYEPRIMQVAMGWLDKALSVAADFETYYLYSYGLGIMGDYDGARVKALKAKETARDEDQKAAADDIINMIEEAAAGE